MLHFTFLLLCVLQPPQPQEPQEQSVLAPPASEAEQIIHIDDLPIDLVPKFKPSENSDSDPIDPPTLNSAPESQRPTQPSDNNNLVIPQDPSAFPEGPPPIERVYRPLTSPDPVVPENTRSPQTAEAAQSISEAAEAVSAVSPAMPSQCTCNTKVDVQEVLGNGQPIHAAEVLAVEDHTIDCPLHSWNAALSTPEACLDIGLLQPGRKQAQLLPSPELELVVVKEGIDELVASSTWQWTGKRFNQKEREATVPWCPLELRVLFSHDLSQYPIDAVRIWIDGKQQHPSLLTKQATRIRKQSGPNLTLFPYGWSCPPLGHHLIQVSYLSDHRWSPMSAPLRFEILPPPTPSIIAVGKDSYPAKQTQDHAVKVSSHTELTLSGVNDGDRVTVEIDGEPRFKDIAVNAGCTIDVPWQSELTPGRYQLRVRSVPANACRGLSSDPSKPIWIDLFDPNGSVQISSFVKHCDHNQLKDTSIVQSNLPPTDLLGHLKQDAYLHSIHGSKSDKTSTLIDNAVRKLEALRAAIANSKLCQEEGGKKDPKEKDDGGISAAQANAAIAKLDAISAQALEDQNLTKAIAEANIEIAASNQQVADATAEYNAATRVLAYYNDILTEAKKQHEAAVDHQAIMRKKLGDAELYLLQTHSELTRQQVIYRLDVLKHGNGANESNKQIAEAVHRYAETLATRARSLAEQADRDEATAKTLVSSAVTNVNQARLTHVEFRKKLDKENAKAGAVKDGVRENVNRVRAQRDAKRIQTNNDATKTKLNELKTSSNQSNVRGETHWVTATTSSVSTSIAQTTSPGADDDEEDRGEESDNAPQIEIERTAAESAAVEESIAPPVEHVASETITMPNQQLAALTVTTIDKAHKCEGCGTDLCKQCGGCEIWNIKSTEVDHHAVVNDLDGRQQNQAYRKRVNTLGSQIDALITHLNGVVKENAELLKNIQKHTADINGSVGERATKLLQTQAHLDSLDKLSEQFEHHRGVLELHLKSRNLLYDFSRDENAFIQQLAVSNKLKSQLDAEFVKQVSGVLGATAAIFGIKDAKPKVECKTALKLIDDAIAKLKRLQTDPKNTKASSSEDLPMSAMAGMTAANMMSGSYQGQSPLHVSVYLDQHKGLKDQVRILQETIVDVGIRIHYSQMISEQLAENLAAIKDDLLLDAIAAADAINEASTNPAEIARQVEIVKSEQRNGNTINYGIARENLASAKVGITNLGIAKSQIEQIRTARDGLRRLHEKLRECISHQVAEQRYLEAMEQRLAHFGKVAEGGTIRQRMHLEYVERVLKEGQKALVRRRSLLTPEGLDSYERLVQSRYRTKHHDLLMQWDLQNSSLNLKSDRDKLKTAKEKANHYWETLELQAQIDDALRASAPPTKTIFHTAGHFPLPRFGNQGLDDAREGISIIEGMEMITKANGDYEISMKVLRASIPAKLFLQLEFLTDKGAQWQSITLQPIDVTPANHAAIFVADHSDVDTDVFVTITRSGNHPALKKCGGRVVRVRRNGNARFGYGFDGLNLYSAN